ncbi:thioredoxin domain-containing protein [Cryobacterium zhongshanensis]|uniref:Thioredoxin domain-containing protein n=1 Tax=Cryobacterium zhongshanensis TaxID=2928153 RepID=A0AA41UGP6_9MICO|nr:thioredoxin domain-containing protein [Cryobacterium zhongshanensis]MCI4657549.1 thioredoxin domain-containing protein [Cryobacterium zhongshanensis]
MSNDTPEPYPSYPEQPGLPATPQQGLPAPSPQHQGFPQVPPTNTLAIVSLVSAFAVSLVAVITGHLALGQIARRGERGRGLAIAGLVLGYVGLASTAVIVVLSIVFAAAFGHFFVNLAQHGGFGGPVASATSEPDASQGVLPSGTLGAAHFDDGYLSVGTGSTIVDEYIDPMCPYCGQFEATNGALLASRVDEGSITLRIHALTFLDQASQGTYYSTRASAALTCVATVSPDATLDYLAALFANQPEENSQGLTDGQLAALAPTGTDISDCIARGEYQLWSEVNTDDALNGPIPGAEIDSIQGTPTVLIDGAQYPGGLTDSREFEAFLDSGSGSGSGQATTQGTSGA